MDLTANALLRPYVPPLVIEWLRDAPGERYRGIEATAVFADVSGFTALTERLARRGRAGSEEIGDVLNALFDELFVAVAGYGASLVKWGGDAMLLLFDGNGHTERALCNPPAPSKIRSHEL